MTRNHSVVLCTLSMAAMTFGLGGYAVWMPTFFNRVWGMDVGQAGKLFGVITVVGGLIGSLAGGWLADFTLKFNFRAYFLVSGIGLLVSSRSRALHYLYPGFREWSLPSSSRKSASS